MTVDCSVDRQRLRRTDPEPTFVFDADPDPAF